MGRWIVAVAAGGSVQRIQGTAAVVIDSGDDLGAALIDDAVMTSVGAAAGLGFEVGPVLDGKTPLFAPAIGMKRLNDIHGRAETQLGVSRQDPAGCIGMKTAGCLRDQEEIQVMLSTTPLGANKNDVTPRRSARPSWAWTAPETKSTTRWASSGSS